MKGIINGITSNDLITATTRETSIFLSNAESYGLLTKQGKKFNGYGCQHELVVTKYPNLLSGTAVGTAGSLCWPWIIRVDNRISGAKARYYMYYSSDHASNTGGIWMAYSDSLTSNWTVYGQVYRNKVGSTYYETETPSVIFNTEHQEFIMYFQSAGSTTGEAQTSFYVTSKDGITWDNKTKLFDLDGERIQSNLHNGYVIPFKIGNMLFAYSLMGGGNGGAAFHYSEDGGYTWTTDHRRLGRLGIPASNDYFMYPNHCMPVSINGNMYLMGIWSNFASGTGAKIASIGLGLMSDVRTMIGTPKILIEPENEYESNDLRTFSVYEEDGELYAYYSCQVSSVTYINCAKIVHQNVEAAASHSLVAVNTSDNLTVDTAETGTATITFEASSLVDEVITYQWYQVSSGGSTLLAIDGATSSTYTLDTSMYPGTYSYQCVATSKSDSLNSRVIVVTVTGKNSYDFGGKLAYIPLSAVTDNTTFLVEFEEADIQWVHGKQYVTCKSPANNTGTTGISVGTNSTGGNMTVFRTPTTSVTETGIDRMSCSIENQDRTGLAILVTNNTVRYTTDNWVTKRTGYLAANNGTRQAYNGYLYINTSDYSNAVTTRPEEYATNQELYDAMKSGAQYYNYDLLKIKTLKIWPNTKMATIDDVNTTTVTPEIDLKINQETGLPYNAGTGGDFVIAIGGAN